MTCIGEDVAKVLSKGEICYHFDGGSAQWVQPVYRWDERGSVGGRNV